MRFATFVGLLSLAAACSRPGVTAASQPDAGTVQGSPPPDAGSSLTGPAYHVLDLGSLHGGAGAILDLSRSGLALVSSESGAFVYDLASGATRDVPRGAVINSAGVVAGIRPTDHSDDCSGFEVFLQNADGSSVGLGTPSPGATVCLAPGEEYNRIVAIDDTGLVVAEWTVFDGQHFFTREFSWNGAVWQRLPGLGGAEDDYGSAVTASNGVVYGGSLAPAVGTSLPQAHAVMWRDGVLTDLGCCGAARAVNDRGEIAGTSSNAAIWSGGAPVDLGTLPGTFGSGAAAIGHDGQIVGSATYSLTEGGVVTRGVIFSAGQIYDLNDVVDSHDVFIASASRLSDSGVIAAYGGGQHPLLLVPTGAALVPDFTWRTHGAVLASGEAASGLALDADNVYWIATTGDRAVTIKTTPKLGGPVNTLFRAGGASTFGNLRADDRYLWFDLLDLTSPSDDSAIWRIPKAGGEAERVADGFERLAVSDSAVFTTDGQQNVTRVTATPKAGGASTALASTQEIEGGLAADAAGVYFVQIKLFGNFNLPVLSLAASGGVADLAVSPIQGGFYAGALALDAESIYLRDPSHLWRFARAGGAPQLLGTIEAVDGYRHDLELSDGFVYLTEGLWSGAPGCVARVPAVGGAKECLDSGFWRYASVRADDSAIFFIRDLEIVRLPK